MWIAPWLVLLTVGVDCIWNVMAHAQKPDFVLRRNGRVHLNRQGRQFSLLLAAEVCASGVVMVVMLDTPYSEVVWRVLATHDTCQFPLPFPSRASPCAITFQLDSNKMQDDEKGWTFNTYGWKEKRIKKGSGWESREKDNAWKTYMSVVG